MGFLDGGIRVPTTTTIIFLGCLDPLNTASLFHHICFKVKKGEMEIPDPFWPVLEDGYPKSRFIFVRMVRVESDIVQSPTEDFNAREDIESQQKKLEKAPMNSP